MKTKYLPRFHWSQTIIALLPFTLALPAQAGTELPTQPGTVHFDLNPGMERDILPSGGLPLAPNPVVGGPCNLFDAGFQCQFTDSLNSVENWRAELIIANPNSSPDIELTITNYPLNLVYPGGNYQALLTLAQGEEAHFIFEATDGAVGKETGTWNFVMENVGAFVNNNPALQVPIAIDSAITEVFEPGGIAPPPFNNFVGFFNTQTGDRSSNPLNSIDFDVTLPPETQVELIQSVPEPSSIVGLGVLGLGLLFKKNKRQSDN